MNLYIWRKYECNKKIQLKYIDNFIFTFIVSLLLGSVAFFNKKNIKKISIYQKILTVVLGYFILPILLSIPYYLIINKISFIDSYFEAISGFTSTGFTIFNNLKHLDESLLLWRSSTQWLGGLYFLISIILLIDIFDKNLKKSILEKHIEDLRISTNTFAKTRI